MNKAECGRLGGLATRDKYGLSFFRINGAKGGRPRLKIYSELFPAPAANNKKEARMIGDLDRLSHYDLLELWKIKKAEGLAIG